MAKLTVGSELYLIAFGPDGWEGVAALYAKNKTDARKKFNHFSEATVWEIIRADDAAKAKNYMIRPELVSGMSPKERSSAYHGNVIVLVQH